MKNILVIFTGGTICTTLKEGKMNTDETASFALLDTYKKGDSFCKKDITLVPNKNFGILSENMTVDKWNDIISHLKTKLSDLNDIKGIIIAHGTDTLAYSAALFSELLRGISVPVFFVSSSKPILTKDEKVNADANGIDNFKYAVECIYKEITPDVYVTYKNTDNKMYLHKGQNLIQCRIYEDDFYSRGMLDITDFKNQIPKNKAITEKEPLIMRLENPLCDCVLKIEPYVALNYSFFNLEGVRAVLHSTYHSGTSCVVKTENEPEIIQKNSSILTFFERCAQRDIPFFYSPSKRGAEADVYASVPFIEECEAKGKRVNFCYGMTNELLYARLLIACSMNLNETDIYEYINTPVDYVG